MTMDHEPYRPGCTSGVHDPGWWLVGWVLGTGATHHSAGATCRGHWGCTSDTHLAPPLALTPARPRLPLLRAFGLRGVVVVIFKWAWSLDL